MDAGKGTGSEAGRYQNLGLTSIRRLSELLTHVYVLLPVLDNRKHYPDRRSRGREAWQATTT